MSNIEKQYQGILRKLVLYGSEKGDRTGTGTLSYFGGQIRHNMADGFPLLTTKRMAVKTMMTELKWFLKGDTNIKYLVDNGCNIWNGDAYNKYCKAHPSEYEDDMFTQEEFIEHIKEDESFAKNWGELGPIYGKQWRGWKTNTVSIDQIQDLISELKTNPDSRRLMVSAWNVGELDKMTLPPCHYGFQVYTRELSDKERYDYWFKNNYETGMEYNESNIPNFDDDYYTITPKRSISLMWNQRSVDTFLGLPFNIASYGLLLEIIAKEVNMVPDELIGNLGDVHLYKNHIEQAKEQLTREPKRLPTLEIIEREEQNFSMDEMYIDNFQFPNYQSHPSIKAPLSN